MALTEREVFKNAVRRGTLTLSQTNRKLNETRHVIMSISGSVDRSGADRTSDRAGAAQGVSGTREASAPSDGIDNSFCNARDGAVRLSHLCCHPREYFDRSGTIYRIFLERKHAHRLLRKSECRGFITKTHIDQRQISNEDIVIRLFFEETVPVRYAPGANFPGQRHGRQRLVVPSLTKAQFAIVVTQCRIRVGKHFT